MEPVRDLRELLHEWPYDPENDLRLGRAADGREVLQVRLPLGVEQYELDGRPDGLRPENRESWLEVQCARLQSARAQGLEGEFSLSADDCAALFSEGLLYYNRYFHLFRLRDWARTVRDTRRNLRLFDFVKQHADRDEDQQYLEKWRPYIVRVHGFAAAMIDVEHGHSNRAIERIRTTIRQIEGLPDLEDETFQFERERSLAILRELANQVEVSSPVSELERLEQELRVAIHTQEFERAALLRDQIKALRTAPPPG